jgi:hypothetical protein
MNKKGFLLISFLVYLMLFSIIVCLLSTTMTQNLFTVISSTRKYNNFVRLYNALDIVVNDLRNNVVTEWKKISPHEIIWSTHDKDVAWLFNGTHIERKEGTYQQGWKKSTKSIIPAELLSVIFIPDYSSDNKNTVLGIEIQLSSSYTTEPVRGYGAIRYKKELCTEKTVV